jgi:hypothetical protein
MAISDYWFFTEDENNLPGGQDKEEVMKAVKKSRLKDLIGPTSSPAVYPSKYEFRKLIMNKKSDEAFEKKVKNKPTIRQLIANG